MHPPIHPDRLDQLAQDIERLATSHRPGDIVQTALAAIGLDPRSRAAELRQILIRESESEQLDPESRAHALKLLQGLPAFEVG